VGLRNSSDLIIGKALPKCNQFPYNRRIIFQKGSTMSLPACPNCQSVYTYEDGALLICPECGHEWSVNEPEPSSGDSVFRDANGNALQDGDSVTVIKDLKVKGSSLVVKVGTKVKNIRLVDG